MGNTGEHNRHWIHEVLLDAHKHLKAAGLEDGTFLDDRLNTAIRIAKQNSWERITDALERIANVMEKDWELRRLQSNE